MNAAQADILEKLAEALFPLKDWFPADPAKRQFQPPPPLDWRPSAGEQTLTIHGLNGVDFIAKLLTNEDDDRALAERWRAVAAHPLEFHDSLPGRQRWRKSRRGDDGSPALEPDPKKVVFGAAASGNFVRVEEGRPVTRGEHYDQCLGPLEDLVRQFPAPVDWTQLAAELLADKAPAWPAGIPTSSEFIRQFCKDILYAALNFQSSAPGRYPEAVAIELGEGRRPGNAYSVLDSQRAVVALKKKLGSAGGSRS